MIEKESSNLKIEAIWPEIDDLTEEKKNQRIAPIIKVSMKINFPYTTYIYDGEIKSIDFHLVNNYEEAIFYKDQIKSVFEKEQKELDDE